MVWASNCITTLSQAKDVLADFHIKSIRGMLWITQKERCTNELFLLALFHPDLLLGWLVVWLGGCKVEWLVGWLVCVTAGWCDVGLVGRLGGWWVGLLCWLLGVTACWCDIGWRDGWLDVRLFRWLVGCMDVCMDKWMK